VAGVGGRRCLPAVGYVGKKIATGVGRKRRRDKERDLWQWWWRGLAGVPAELTNYPLLSLWSVMTQIWLRMAEDSPGDDVWFTAAEVGEGFDTSLSEADPQWTHTRARELQQAIEVRVATPPTGWLRELFELVG